MWLSGDSLESLSEFLQVASWGNPRTGNTLWLSSLSSILIDTGVARPSSPHQRQMSPTPQTPREPGEYLVGGVINGHRPFFPVLSYEGLQVTSHHSGQL